MVKIPTPSSKVIEANPYRKPIATVETTWCVSGVSVSVLLKTEKVEKTLFSNALKKIGSKNTCYSCTLTSAKYERIYLNIDSVSDTMK